METPTPTSSHFGVRERWLTTAFLGLGLITFAIDASNTQLILPQVMTSLRVEMPPNLIYGVGVLLVGRLSDRLPTYVLVISGLLMYAAVFVGFRGINEVATFGMFMTFLTVRFIAEAFIVSPNNLATLEALPESQVYMATALSGLLRNIANTMGTAVATILAQNNSRTIQ